ncbi:MAG: hypothetical protein DI498_07275 [Paracoccus denitrificans]|nr:MAG: hypothetical protein DI498_07275 [Paracoccus denitrificans]PZO84602.1 MAG: hypothetical protein DI633_07275 [Paracoccus denitrificans]
MRRFNNAAVGITRGAEVLFSAFEDNGEMWSGTGMRIARHDITFSEPFLDYPVVHVSLGMWDIASDANQRADIQADFITHTGFQIVFRTWGDTRVARVRAEWMAIGPVPYDVDFDVD